MRRPLARALALLAALVAAPASAAGLDSVRAMLHALREAEPLRAEIVREVTYEQKDSRTRHGKATVTVADDATGLQIGFAPEPLRRAAAEQAQTDPDEPRPVSEGLRSIDPADVHAMVGYAQRLLAALDGATLTREVMATRDGATARQLEIELPVRLNEAGRKRVKHATRTMTLWCAPDYTPLALEERAEFRGRIFLVIGFEVHQSRALEFARAGDRLVVLRDESRSGGSGLGESASETRITTLRLL